MNTAKRSLEEVLEAGYDALFRGLGYIDATRFLRQSCSGHGNYTEERREWVGELTLDELLAEARRLQSEGDAPPGG